jgi:hypothetical protein
VFGDRRSGADKRLATLRGSIGGWMNSVVHDEHAVHVRGRRATKLRIIQEASDGRTAAWVRYCAGRPEVDQAVHARVSPGFASTQFPAAASLLP